MALRQGLLVAALLAAASGAPVPAALVAGDPMPAAEARVMNYRAVFTAPPKKIPSDNSVDAPLLGNGDTLAALGGSPDKLRFHINKNDLWLKLSAEGGTLQGRAGLYLPGQDIAATGDAANTGSLAS